MAVIKPPRTDIKDKTASLYITIYIRIPNTDVLDAVHVHRASISGLRLEGYEAIAVVSAQSVPCCHPYHAILVLHQARGVMMRQAVQFVESSLHKHRLCWLPSMRSNSRSMIYAPPHKQQDNSQKIWKSLCSIMYEKVYFVLVHAKVRNNW